jgi:hypothetical protein
MRVITVLHEVFGHQKRVIYSAAENVLQRTPEKFKFGDDQPEVGNYIEKSLFGRLFSESTPREISEKICDPELWAQTNPPFDFASLFIDLP